MGRSRKTGVTEADRERYERAISRIFENIDVDEESGCSIWKGSLDSLGYPIVILNGRKWRVHRLLYQRLYNLGETEKLVQACGNNLCVEPKHMTVRGDKVYWPDGVIKFYKGYKILLFRVKRGKWAWRIGQKPGIVSLDQYTSQKLALNNAYDMVDDPDISHITIFREPDINPKFEQYPAEDQKEIVQQWLANNRDVLK